jgi:hypothetical protein
MRRRRSAADRQEVKMNFFQKAKQWIMEGSVEEGEASTDEGRLPTEGEFVSFYRTIALEIQADIDYEKDFTYTLHESSAVIQRFSPKKYADRINEYFRERGVYKKSPFDGSVMQLLLIILAPPMDADIRLNREIRIHLFNAVLKETSRRTKENLPALIRAIYDKVRFSGTSLHGIEQTEILDLLRGSASQFEVELKIGGGPEQTGPGRERQPVGSKPGRGPESSGKKPAAAADGSAQFGSAARAGEFAQFGSGAGAEHAELNKTLPADLLQVLGIRTHKDFDRVFKRFSTPEFWTTSILELVLILVLVIYKEPLISLLGANLAEAALDSEAAAGADIVVIAINALLILMIAHLFFRAVRYAGVAARRRQLKQLFAGLEKKGYFHRTEAEAAVKTLFGNEKLFF